MEGSTMNGLPGHALRGLAVAATLLGFCTLPAHAATSSRTWVSASGSDSNACTRAAPCQTFTGALAKTTAGGEIDVIGPGDYGPVTITQAVTIRAVGKPAGILVTSGDAISINAGSLDAVNLIGLDLASLSADVGISIVGAARVHIVKCKIRGFGIGIDVLPSAASTVVLATDTVLEQNNLGVVVAPTTVAAKVVIDHAAWVGEGLGIGVGLEVDTATGSSVVNNSTITANGTGLVAEGGGNLFTYGNNRVNFNGDNGGPNQAVLTTK
jgi:hypothetical protein